MLHKKCFSNTTASATMNPRDTTKRSGDILRQNDILNQLPNAYDI